MPSFGLLICSIALLLSIIFAVVFGDALFDISTSLSLSPSLSFYLIIFPHRSGLKNFVISAKLPLENIGSKLFDGNYRYT